MYLLESILHKKAGDYAHSGGKTSGTHTFAFQRFLVGFGGND